jgi:acyl-CoA synthetase (AMP-forming)/AMP-acid ligase II
MAQGMGILGNAAPNPVIERIRGHAARCDGSAFLTLVDRQQGETRLSLAQFLARAEEWCARYRQAGLQPGDKIVVILEHGEALYASYLGALLGGFCPAYFAHPSEKIDADRYCESVHLLLQAIGGDFVVSSRAILERIKLEAPHGIYEDGSPFAAAARRGKPRAAPAESALFMQFSSGTTGLKKCVAISAEALLWQVDAYAERMNVSAGDRVASWLPLYHDMGLIACFMLPLLRNIPLAAISPFDWVKSPGMLFDVVSRHRSTLIWLPNFAFNFLAARAAPSGAQRWDLSSVRAIVNCSEPVLDSSHREFMSRFGEFGMRAGAITTCYAMAENTFAVTSGRPGRLPVAEIVDSAGLAPGQQVTTLSRGTPASKTVVGSGTPLPQVRVSILDGNRAALGEGHVGEIAISAPSLFSGYYGNRSDTESAFQDGTFLTGDLGYLRNDELFVIGRIKDTIIVAGRNIFPQDLEAVINETEGAIPGRCVVFGVDDPALGTERLVAIAETNLTDDQSRRALRRRIRLEILRRTDVIPSEVALAEHMWLQKSSSGKLSRALNRQRYLEAKRLDLEAQGSRRTSAGFEPLSEAVRSCVANAIGASVGRAVPDFDENDDLLREGILDSFSMVAMQLALEDRFGAAAAHPIREHPGLYGSVAAIAGALSAHFANTPEPAGTPAMSPDATSASPQSAKYTLAPQMHDVEAQAYEWFAYLMRRGMPDFRSATLNTDEHGFRSTYRDGELLTFRAFADSRRPKAIVLGNSFAYGVGTTHDSKTFASCLNAMQTSSAYLWYNFAQRASVIRQERLAFELYSPAVPQLVLWVSGVNNLVSLIVGEGLPDNPAPFVGERHFSSRMMPDRRYGQLPGSEQRYQAMLAQLEVDISTLALRLRGNGRMLFCLQPSATWVDKALTPEEEELIAVFDSAGAPLHQAHGPQYLKPLHSRFSRDVAMMCRHWDVDYLDCNEDPRMAERNWLFIDRTHMTDAGHALIAEIAVQWASKQRRN